MRFIFLIALLSCSFISEAQTSTLYSVSPNNNNLSIIDTSNYSANLITLTSSLGIVDGCNGLEVDPNNPCNIYVVYKVVGNRRLGLVDPGSGVITDIGSLSENIANISFGSFGLLFAVSGDGSATPESFYELNTATATLSYIMSLGNGDDGESIAYNPDDGLMYHWSGWGSGDVVMETINLLTFNVGPTIPLSGSPLLNVGASTYIGNNTFMVSDVNGGGIHFVTTTGVVSSSPITTGPFKGLTMVENPVSVSVTPGDTICANEVAMLTANGPGLNHGWFLDGVPLNDSSMTYNANLSGEYTVEMNNNGCVFISDPVTITVNPVPNVNLSPSSMTGYCANDSVQLQVTGGTNADFQWYSDGTPIAGATSNIYFASSDGLYNCTKTNANGCTDSSSIGIIVSQYPSPVATLSSVGSLNICTGDSVELMTDTAGIVQFQWYMNGMPLTGDTLSSYFAVSAGEYNCVVTNAQGCSDSASVGLTLTESALPSVSLNPGGSAQFCEGDSVELSVNNATQYQWYMNGSPISGASSSSYFVGADGLYNCYVTDANGCSDSSVVGVVVNESPLPTVTLTPSGTINFCPVDGPVTITADAGLAVEFYQWYADGNMIPMETMNGFMTSTEGTYNCIITSSAGCADSSVMGVTLIDTCSTTIEDLDLSGILVYPNPSSDFINVDLGNFDETIVGMTLVSNEGRIVHQTSALDITDSNVKIDVTNEVEGVYFLIIKTSSKRFIKEVKIE